MAPTLRAKNEKPPERATQKEDGDSSYSSDSDSHKVPQEPEQAKRREARPAEAQSPERKRKRPSAKSPELKKKKANPLEPKRNAPSAEAKKTLPFQRTWTPDDEVQILEVLAAHRQENGELPNSHVLFAYLDGRLDKKCFRRRDLDNKVRSLKRRHNNDAKKGTAPTKEHERCLYHLSKNVWGDMPQPMDAAGAKSGGGQTNMDAQVPSAGKTFDEMRELYPYLTQELILLVDAEAQPAVLERVLPSIDDSKAHALELKIMKLKEELTKAIMESV